MKKVTIITVCYNSEKTIEKTILSIISQSYRNIEYIIIDGGSTDNTMQIIYKYRNNISLYISEPDDGIYDAMNKGIKYSTGDIIGIVNSDDWLERDALEKVVKYSALATDKNYIMCGCMNMIKDGKVLKVNKSYPANLWEGMTICHPATFISRQVYEVIGKYNTNYRIAADYDLLLRAKTKNINFIEVPEVFTNFSFGGVSTLNELDSKIEDIHISLSYLDNCSNIQKVCDKCYERLKKACFIDMLGKDTSIQGILAKLNINSIIAVFGYGVWGKRIIGKLNKDNIDYGLIIDNNVEIIGKVIDKKRINDPNVLKDKCGSVIVANINEYEDIREQILEYSNDIDIFSVDDLMRECLSEYCVKYENIKQIYGEIKSYENYKTNKK